MTRHLYNFFVERIEGISLIGLPNVELLPDPEDPDEELEFLPFVVGGTLELDEFVSQDDEEFRGESKEEVDD